MSPDLPSWLRKASAAKDDAKTKADEEAQRRLVQQENSKKEVQKRAAQFEKEARHYIKTWDRLDIDNILQDLLNFFGGDTRLESGQLIFNYAIKISIRHPNLNSAIEEKMKDQLALKGISGAIVKDYKYLQSSFTDDGSDRVTSPVFTIDLDRDGLHAQGELLGDIKTPEELKDKIDTMIAGNITG